MAKTNYKTWVTSELVTAAMLNEQIRDNGNEIWKGIANGDLDFYTSATTKTRLPIGAEGTLLSVTSGVPAWKSLLYKRQGGSSAQWSTPGTNNYTPTTAKIQAGVVTISVSGANQGSVTVTYPEAFTDRPIVIVSRSINSGVVYTDFGTSGHTASGFTVTAKFSTTVTTAVDVQWLAIGY